RGERFGGKPRAHGTAPLIGLLTQEAARARYGRALIVARTTRGFRNARACWGSLVPRCKSPPPAASTVADSQAAAWIPGSRASRGRGLSLHRHARPHCPSHRSFEL